MDDWGDPWADDNLRKSPAKPPAAFSTQPTFSAGLPVLPGFADDAQWGDWAAEDSQDQQWLPDKTSDTRPTDALTAIDPARLPTHQPLALDPANEPTPPRSPTVHFESPAITNLDASAAADDPWNAFTKTDPPPFASVLSPRETSTTDTIAIPPTPSSLDASLSQKAGFDSDWNDTESGTTATISATPAHVTNGHDDTNENSTPEKIGAAETTEDVEDDNSTRPSTSPSEVDHAEESPRTSLDEEHRVAKELEAERTSVEEPTPSLPAVNENTNSKAEEEDDFGDFEEEPSEDLPEPTVGSAQEEKQLERTPATPIKAKAPSEHLTPGPASPRSPDSKPSPPPSRLKSPSAAFNVDLSSLSSLFAPPQPSDELPDVESPISSTSARKAWYRISRKETMREFNSGLDEDSYVRVTWNSSTVRTEATKIVARWMKEDRAAGRATFDASPGAMFGWDQPARPLDIPKRSSRVMSKARKLSVSGSGSTPSSPISQAPLRKDSVSATPSIPQFGWSSSPIAKEAPIDLASSEKSSSRESFAGVKLAPPPASVSPAPSAEIVLPKRTKANGVPPLTDRESSAEETKDLELNVVSRSASGEQIEKQEAAPPEIGDMDDWDAFESSRLTSQEPIRSTVPVEGLVANSQSPSNTDLTANNSFHQNSLAKLDTAPAILQQSTEEDDEFGEMVQSPAFPPLEFRAVTPVDTSPLDFTAGTLKRSATGTFHTPSNSISSVATQGFVPNEPASDPWASADFSIFDAPAPPSKPIPSAHSRNPSVPTVLSAVPARLKTPRPLSLPPTPSPQTALHPPSYLPSRRTEQEQADHAVREVIQGLPNLSYMLR